MDFVRQLSGVGVLERIPIPSLAMARDGTIIFANAAFAQMIGYQQDTLTGSAFLEIFRRVPGGGMCDVQGLCTT